MVWELGKVLIPALALLLLAQQRCFLHLAPCWLRLLFHYLSRWPGRPLHVGATCLSLQSE